MCSSDLWVEGENEGECPLKKGDGGLSGVVTRPAPPGSPLATLLDDALGEARSVKPFDVQSALDAATRLTQKSVNTIQGSSSSELLGSVGLDSKYVEAELKMLSALASGGALDVNPIELDCFFNAHYLSYSKPCKIYEIK